MGCASSVISSYSAETVDRSNFLFTKVIGSGGFGTVFAAIHTDYLSWFAIKQIDKIELMKHKNGLDMLLGELNAWKQVGNHSYIADLHFAFQDK